MQAYLFVHFKEKTTPDGEQVYFGLSKDGFHWETVNDGNPVLWAYHGDKGVRDFTVTRTQNGKFYILATDLSLAYGMRNQYHNSWEEISKNGSKDLALWESTDLVNWSEQRMVRIGSDEMGCVWAPDVIYDKEEDDYVLHWSSSNAKDNYGSKAIYYSRTKDFEHFSKPEVLYQRKDGDVIDSAIYEENGFYYLFLKSQRDPAGPQLLRAEHVTGEYQEVAAFAACMKNLNGATYEAPTAMQLSDGRWSLYLDFFGVAGAGQGYVPFLADSLSDGRFVRSDAEFSFPYGFKHGTILTITEEEYDRIKSHDWSDKGWI